MPTIKCIKENWFEIFNKELISAKFLKIISPFVSDDLVSIVLNRIKADNIYLITRFNLHDFFLGVSQLKALEKLTSSGGHIKGIKDLHSKVYIFDNKRVIISSSNFTKGGLFNNLEFGLLVYDKYIVSECDEYFNRLWINAGKEPSILDINNWKTQIDNIRVKSNNSLLKNLLKDYGNEILDDTKNRYKQLLAERNKLQYVHATTVSEQKGTVRYFIKFSGTANNRADWNANIRKQIEEGEKHYACSFPRNKRPRQISHGDVLFFARLTHNPNGHAIYGKAEAISYVEGRDDATENEIRRRPWKTKWPHYIRLYNTQFIDGKLSDCVRLNDLMVKFKEKSFASTIRNKIKGAGNLDPRRSFMRKSCIEITPQAAVWLDEEFKKVSDATNLVDHGFLNSLPKSDIELEI